MRKILYAISFVIVLVTIKAVFKVGFNPTPQPAVASTKSIVLAT